MVHKNQLRRSGIDMSVHISFKGKEGWQQHKSCHVGISLNNPNFSEENFGAVIDWLNQQNFQHCFFDLSDTLYRYNLVQTRGYTFEKAAAASREMGDAWLARNEENLARLKVPHHLTRWDAWLEHKDFPKHLAKFTRLFQGSLEFRHAVLTDIYNFRNRKQELLSPYDVGYLLEELSVLALYFKNYPCLKIYPGKEQKILRLLRSGAIKGAPRSFRQIDYAQIWLHRENAGQKAA